MATKSTTERIAIAARRLLNRQGTDAVTMRRVADAVGITPMAVYRHYAGRDGLLSALADQGFAELASALKSRRYSSDLEQRLAEMADIYLGHALKNPRMF